MQLVPGSAAANSPLEVGEVIQSVNGTDCSYCSTDHLADLLLGPEGEFLLDDRAPWSYFACTKVAHRLLIRHAPFGATHVLSM